MKFIIDTNILISSLLKDSTSRELLLNESFDFYLPEIVIREVKKYLPYIIQKTKLPEKEIKNLLNNILENLHLVPIEEYVGKLNEGMEIMGKIDEKDSPFIALALSIENDGIWSNDKHFEQQEKISVFKTIDIINFLENLSKKENKNDY